MTPEEAASRRRHPTASGRRGSPALRAVHSDSHKGGQEASRESDTAATVLALLFIALLAGGALAALWAGDWRWLATAIVVGLVVAYAGGRGDRRPR